MGSNAGVVSFAIQVCAFPPFPQKKAERMGHGAFSGGSRCFLGWGVDLLDGARSFLKSTLFAELRNEVIGVGVFYGELRFRISFQVAPLVPDIENQLVSLGDDLCTAI